MKTPKSASRPEKGGSTLTTPTSGKITKNKSTPMSLKAKVLEKNAKLALLKSQDNISLNGKSPKTPKNVGTPKKGSPSGSPGSKKGSKPGQNQTPKSPIVSPDLNGTAGKKRKSLEGTPVNASGKKSKKTPEVSPEVKLGLRIEKFLESPKDQKPVEAASPGGKKQKSKKKKNKAKALSAGSHSPESVAQTTPDGPPSPGSTGKKSRRQRQKEAKARKKALAAEQGGPVVDEKKKKLQQKVDAKKLVKKDSQVKQKGAPPPESQKLEKSNKKTKNDKKRERRLSKPANESRDNLLKELASSPSTTGSFPNPTFAANAIKAILEDEKQRAAEKPELLDDPSPVLLVADFFYHPPARGTQRIALPNPHLTKDPDVIFIATDMKKAKNDFEESIDFHTSHFRSNGVASISEIIPLRKLMKEYTQLEEKRKLVNRADVILIDAKIAHRISSLIPRKLLQKKSPIPVRIHLKNNELKKEVATALKKTTVLLKENSLNVAIKIGHIGMKKEALADNLAVVATALSNEKMFPGGRPNVRQLHVKTPKSDSYPVYISVVPRSQIPKPKAPPKKKKETVEGEVSTAGVTVAVHPDGEIKIKSKDVDLNETEHDTSPKKKKDKKMVSNTDSDEDDSDFDDADSDDDLDPAEIEKFIKANKPDDDEDSSDEEGGEIEKAEQEFLLQLRKQQDALEADAQKAKKAGKKGMKAAPADDDDDESDEDDEEDDLDEEEDELDDEEEEVDEADGDEEEEDESDDDDDVPDLVRAEVAPPQKGKGGKPGRNGLQAKGKPVAQKSKPVAAQKGKPVAAQKGKPNPAQKGKPNAVQKRGSFQKTKDSPKAKRR